MAETDSSPIEVGLLRQNDYAQIAELYLISRADALPYLNRVHTDDETRSFIQKVALNRGVTWVARQGDQVAGFLNLVGESIDQFFLLPGFYRRGIGSRLLDCAKAGSPSCLRLYTFQKNTRARAFYEKHGFKAVTFTDGARNEEKEPDILFEWRGAAGSTEDSRE